MQHGWCSHTLWLHSTQWLTLVMSTGLKRGETTVHHLIEQLKRGVNMQPVHREMLASIIKLHNMQPGTLQIFIPGYAQKSISWRIKSKHLQEGVWHLSSSPGMALGMDEGRPESKNVLAPQPSLIPSPLWPHMHIPVWAKFALLPKHILMLWHFEMLLQNLKFAKYEVLMMCMMLLMF